MTTKDIEARIEVLNKLLATPISDAMVYAFERARLKAELAKRAQKPT